MKSTPPIPIRCLPSILGALALAAASSMAQNLDLPYSSGSTGEDGPFTVPALLHPAINASMVYDPIREQCLYFGGSSPGNAAFFGTTWTFDENLWTPLAVAGPPARAAAGMAFDTVRGEVVLFGGLGADLARRNDTWTWNGTTWTQKFPENSPPARSGPCMAWDEARGEVVLFGGAGGSGLASDMWAWNGTDWTERTPPAKPGACARDPMAFDPASGKVILHRTSDSGPVVTETWSWDGTTWANRGGGGGIGGGSMLASNPEGGVFLLGGGTSSTLLWNDATSTWNPIASSRAPTARSTGVAVFDEAREQLVVSHGSANDTWVWREGDWFGVTGVYHFDMNSRADGIWNFTSISIHAATEVRFLKNAANHGVLWLASDNVTIDGTVTVSGAGGVWSNTGVGGKGGPGGFDGGDTGLPGNGPGGGAVGPAPGSNALHADATGAGPYGTLFAQPVIGGSGGGGYAGNGLSAGSSGGGGGGAIVIAGSRDINVNGTILAAHGGGGGLNASTGFAGTGSGGLIRLVADRVLLGPSAQVNAGNQGTSGKGRVRIEGYVRQIPSPATQLIGSTSLSVPVPGSVLVQAGGRLLFTKVDGVTVTNPPRGDEVNPDVIFSATGTVDIEVEAINIPDGTPVSVTVDHSLAGTITLDPVPLVQSKAIFTTTIPAGSGRMLANATYNVGGPTGNGQP